MGSRDLLPLEEWLWVASKSLLGTGGAVYGGYLERRARNSRCERGEDGPLRCGSGQEVGRSYDRELLG